MQQVTDELRILVEAEVERAIKNIERFDSAMDGSEKTTASFSEALSAVEKKSLDNERSSHHGRRSFR